MKTLSFTIAALAILVGVSCSESETEPITTAQQNAQVDAQRLLVAPPIPDIQGTQKIYFRDNLFKIDVMRSGDVTAAAVAESGEPIAKLFYTVDYPSKLVADSFSKRLTQYGMLYLIEFKGGERPYQFQTMSEIENAHAAGKISVMNTELLYLFTRI